MPSCGKVIQSDVPFPSKPHDDMAISIDEAENVLLDVMNQIGNMKTKSGNVAARTIANKYSVNLSAGTKAVSTEVPIHIFNFENESGFAIMSGDKRIPPLLAYTFEGNMKEGEHIDDPGLALYISKLNAYCRNVIDTIIRLYPQSAILNTSFNDNRYDIELDNNMKLYIEKNGKLIGRKYEY